MKDNRLLSKNRVGEYVEVEYNGENTSGREPIGDGILILPYEAPEKTKGNVWLPPTIRETQSLAAEIGVIVAVGEGAWTWNHDRTRRFSGRKPQIGEHVNYTRYAGQEVIGNDDKMYRIMEDKAILAVIVTTKKPDPNGEYADDSAPGIEASEAVEAHPG